MSIVAYPVRQLAATLLLEGTAALSLRPSGPRHERLLGSLTMNLVSHPLAITALIAGAPWWTIECAVVTFEVFAWRYTCRLPYRTAITLGVVTNLLSAGVGILLQP